MAKSGDVTLHMVCPNCLHHDCITKTSDENNIVYICENCKSRIVREYATNAAIPRDVISAVGFRGHGKSVYFASLFNTFEDIATLWKGFHSFAIDETSLKTVTENRQMLRQLKLCEATLMNFPSPTVIRLSNIPSLGDRFQLFYDVSGEAYEGASRIVRYASFVKLSNTVLFIVSPTDIDPPGEEIHRLLSTYVQGLSELNGESKKQHLIVVLSKGDRLQHQLQRYDGIWDYLLDGGISELKDFKMGKYIKGMKQNSHNLKKYINDELNGAQFLNFAEERFKTVDYCIISALGAEPKGNMLEARAAPKRLLDPLLWVSYRSMSPINRMMT